MSGVGTLEFDVVGMRKLHEVLADFGVNNRWCCLSRLDVCDFDPGSNAKNHPDRGYDWLSSIACKLGINSTRTRRAHLSLARDGCA